MIRAIAIAMVLCIISSCSLFTDGPVSDQKEESARQYALESGDSISVFMESADEIEIRHSPDELIAGGKAYPIEEGRICVYFRSLGIAIEDDALKITDEEGNAILLYRAK